MSNKLYTLKDWRNDHVLKIKIGQYVDYGVINQLMDGLPPLTYNDGIFQVGEPDDQNVKTGELLFKTFIEDGGYRYVGLCPEGSTVDETKDSYGYQRDRNKNNIQENKKHMKITEKELHNLISECVQEYIQENQENEWGETLKGWLNIGKEDAEEAYNNVKGAVNDKIQQVKTGFNNRKERVNNYSQKIQQAKTLEKHTKIVNKIMPTLQELKTTLKTDNTLNSKQRGYLNSAIRFLNTFIQTLQQQGQQYRDDANAVFNKQQPQQSQPGIAAESTKRLEKIIKESIKRNLK
jgi:hypothetical protein